jgi:hypothetical protein
MATWNPKLTTIERDAAVDNLIAWVVFIGGVLRMQSKSDVGERVRTDCNDGAEDHLGQLAVLSNVSR